MTVTTRIAMTCAAFGLLAAPAAQAQERPVTKGEAKLARMIEGRIAGEPESCIRTLPTRSFTVIDDTAIVYRQGKTLWVNTTRNPESIDDHYFMVVDRFNPTMLCRTDQITLKDRTSGFFSGVLFLSDFVPYRDAES